MIIGGATFQHRTRDKVSWQHPSGRYANQIDHLAISRRFRGCLEDIRNRKVAIGNLRDYYLLVAMLRLRTAAVKQPDEMYRRAPTYFTRRLKFAATAAMFNQSVEEYIHKFRSPSQPNLNWDAMDAVKEVYRIAGDLVIGKADLVIGKASRRWKPWMSDSTWALIEMTNNLKKDIEATSVCSRFALESDHKTKNREVERSTRRDKRSHVEKLAKSAEEAAFVDNLEEVYKIIKE